MNPLPSAQVTGLIQRLAPIVSGLIHRGAGDVFQRDRSSGGQSQHLNGAGHVRGLELAIGGDIAELGAVVEDPAKPLHQPLPSGVVEAQSRLCQIAWHRDNPGSPSVLPEPVVLEVAAQTSAASSCPLSPH